MSKGNIILGLVLTFCILGGAWLTHKISATPLPSVAKNNLPDDILLNLNFTSTDKNGKLQSKISSPKMLHYANGTAKFYQPKLKLYPPKNATLATITADSGTFNQKTGIGTLEGHVKVDQGNTHLRANKVLIYQNKKHGINKLIAIGNPAKYSAIPKGSNNPVFAQSKTIEYNPTTQQVTMKGKIVIQQQNK